jgi:type VI secretion system protein ImpL
MVSSRLGVSRFGVNPVGLTHAAMKSAAERFVSDPNQVDVVTEFEVTYAFLALAEFGARPAPVAPEDGAPPPPPEIQPIDEYQEQLKFVRDALQETLDDPTDKEKLADKLKGARTKVKSLLSAQKDTRWSSTMEKLLWPPIDLTLTSIQNDTTQEKQKKWCNEVVASFERTVSGGYPFNPNGHDVALADFKAFFEPADGELWAYYDKALKNAIPLKGNRFELADLGSSGGKYRQNVASFLNAANEVSQVMFPRGAEGAEVEFDVMIEGAPGIKEIVLTVDGEKVKYRNGPQVWGTLTWPGEGTPGASIEAHGFGKRADLESEGEWGFFRLLEQGKVKQLPGTRLFIAQWDFRDEGAGLIQIKFRPKRADTPFFGYGGRRSFMSIFRTKHLVVPRSVMFGAPSCTVGKG